MDNTAEKDIAQLEELISLAETVSKNLEDAQNSLQIRRLQTVSIVILFCVVTIVLLYRFDFDSFIFNSFNYTVSLPAFILVAIVVTWFRVQTQNIKKTILTESNVLAQLLDTISSYRELTYPKADIMKRAILDMRLSRINFSNAKSEKTTKNERTKSYDLSYKNLTEELRNPV